MHQRLPLELVQRATQRVRRVREFLKLFHVGHARGTVREAYGLVVSCLDSWQIEALQCRAGGIFISILIIFSIRGVQVGLVQG